MRLPLILVLLLAGLGAGEPVELPVAPLLVGETLVDGAGFAWPAKDASMAAAAALGAMPEKPADAQALVRLAATWQPAPPVEGKPVALLIVGPLIEADGESMRLAGVALNDDGITVTLERWTEMVLRSGTPKPQRQAWLLQLPPLSAGPGTVTIRQPRFARHGATGRAVQQGLWVGPVARYVVGVPGAAARVAAALPMSGARPPEPAGPTGEWLPAARLWVHHPAEEGTLLAGIGSLGVRPVDVAAARLVVDRVPLETTLAPGAQPVPCVLINGPQLNSGEYMTLRAAEWTGRDALRVVVAVWQDDMGRDKNWLHQDTWLLPIHPTVAMPQVRVEVVWESRFLDQASRWYRLQPGLPRDVPAGLAAGDVPAAAQGF